MNKSSRDDFTPKIKEKLAKRVNYICSNPRCKRQTMGPSSEKDGTINIGVACHICAAAPGGPRYDKNMNTEQRKDFENGIWLCQNCSKLIDSNASFYTTELLKKWKIAAEEDARQNLLNSSQIDLEKIYNKIENLMKELLDEMTDDLINNPLYRKFVVIPTKDLIYLSSGDEFIYYGDEICQLQEKVNILENYNLVIDITEKNVNRYQFNENFVEWLMERNSNFVVQVI